MANPKIGNSAIFGIFRSREALDYAVDVLKSHGFRNSDISALLPNLNGRVDFGHEKATKAPEGTATGATGGAVVGAGLGWLLGLGLLAIPGIGPFMAVGPLMTALAGAGLGGALGGVTGALIGMGIPEYEAKRYETYVKDGGMLLSVHVDNREWSKQARDILESAGALSVNAKTEKKSPGLSPDEMNL